MPAAAGIGGNMEKDQEVLEVRETVTEEFLINGELVERLQISERLEISVDTVTVALSSGADHEFPYHHNELGHRLRHAAVAYFVGEGKIADDPSLTLFKNKAALDLQKTLGSQGVRAGDELLLASPKPHVDG